ncbi:MAG: acetamidase/formamidase family protein [Solirubrobacterales bacterium]|nr:acetamidase/formamidase family protein [Solirubrobacterales bacterium]
MQTFTPDDLKYTYSPAHEPIGMVAPGETFAVITEDCFTRRYETPDGFTAESSAWVQENLDGVTGPIAVGGAEPGQVVAVAIEELQATTPGAVVVSRCEAYSPADWWHEEDHVVNLNLAEGLISLGDNWLVPARPLIGCLATQPSRETVLSRREGDYCGNVDCGEITAGATVILPVAVAGAGLYFGDCKAAMGDGEVVAAPEIGARIVGSARPLPRPRSMGTPRVITPQTLTTIASDISLADACRTAFKELKLWLQDEWRLTSDQAAVLMGIGAHCRIGQISNQLHTGKCSIDRSLLPDTDGRAAHG